MSAYKVQCAITKEVSKKTWKTYNGALNNCKTPTQFVNTLEGIDWFKRHGEEWTKDRLNYETQI